MLEEIELVGLSEGDVPEAVSAYLEEADRRIDVFFETERNKRIPKFIPSAAEMVFEVIEFVTREELPLGRVFCEWGSGFGVATCLASLLGYEAYGIEIEEELVDTAGALAGDMGIDARFVCSSYLPEGIDSYAGMGGEDIVREGGIEGELGYEGMERDLSDVDIIFVYPWPGEQEFMEKLFEEVAVEGAILIVYYGDEEIRVYRKVFVEGER